MKHLNKIHTDFTLNGNKFNSVENVLIYTKTVSTDIHSFLTHWFANEPTIAVKTSGSTGKPKVIELKKAYMINSALATGTFFNLQKNITALMCLPSTNIAGKMMLVRALILGWHIDVIKPSNNPLDGIKKNYDFCAMVPLQVQNSLAELHKIKTLIIGGAPVNYTLKEALKKHTIKAFETYGMTETITHIAVKQLNTKNNLMYSKSDCHPERSRNFGRRVSLLGSQKFCKNYFEVLPNIKIVKDDRDCLVINAPKIADHHIITNDLVNILDDTHFEWLGRVDNIINSGGVKIVPEIVEQKLASLLPFRFFVTGLPDGELGEKVVLIGEGIPQELDNQKIKEVLLKYEKPKQIIFIDRFEETHTRKINRNKTLKLI